MFFPSWWALLFNPFFFARRNLWLAVRRFAPSLRGDLLDVGCGNMPYQSIFFVDSYSGLEIDSEHARARARADYFYDGKVFPMADASFDSALCNQVLEHVFNPDQFLGEICRVLKPGGQLLLTVPFVWDEHEQPHDFARYSSFGLRVLLERAGFTVLNHEKLGTDASIIFQLANAYVFKISLRMPRYLQFIVTLPLVASINVFGRIAQWILPSNPDLYLDHAILVRKPF